MRPNVFALVFVCLIFAFAAFGQRVIEKDSEIVFRGSDAILQLAVESGSAMSSVEARVALVDVRGNEKSAANGGRRAIQKGRQRIDLVLPIGTLSKDENEDLAWYRVRYHG